jgi:hypothetical protein
MGQGFYTQALVFPGLSFSNTCFILHPRFSFYGDNLHPNSVLDYPAKSFKRTHKNTVTNKLEKTAEGTDRGLLKEVGRLLAH